MICSLDTRVPSLEYITARKFLEKRRWHVDYDINKDLRYQTAAFSVEYNIV